MGHVPWLGRLFLRYPKFAEDLKSFRTQARNRAILRKSSGSPHKDIFHHLVRSSLFLFGLRDYPDIQTFRWMRTALQ